jgi:hypothetical protein
VPSQATPERASSASRQKTEQESALAKYLISFPSAAMRVPEDEWAAVGRDAHAVIDEAKAAGVRCAQELRVFQFDPQS